MLLHQRRQNLSFSIVVEPQGKVNKQTGKDAAEERTLSVKAYGFARFPKGERTLSVCSLRSQPAPPKGGAFMHLSVSRAKPPPLGGGGTAQAVTERVQPACVKQRFPRSAALSQKAALQMPLPITTPSRENAKPERPQTLRLCSIKNNLSAIYAQSERGAHFKSSCSL